MRLMVAVCLFAAEGVAASPFTEKAGATDHPLVGRFKGSVLVNAGSINFERVEFNVGPEQKEAVEGRVFNYFYVAPADRSDLEVFRNFQQALEAARFKLLFVCDDPKVCERQKLGEHASRWTSDSRSFTGAYSALSRLGQNGNYPPRYLVARLTQPNNTVTVVLTVQPPSSTQKDAQVGAPYFLQLIESAAMETGNVVVNAQALSAGLASEGKVTLSGIFFDTGKATLKPESKPQLDEMAMLLAQAPSMKVFIVGHTDNQGSLDANLALSMQRATAVVTALTQTYKVAAPRLQARRVANFAPRASNATEAGRAQNRRVELVQQ
jgi:OmpA-OmpF porin, OOP family